MSNFNMFKDAITKHLNEMMQYPLFRVDVAKNNLWTEYLSSFPEGENPIYKERTVHDCQCCKQFIRNIGDIVYIKDNQLVSVWDLKVDNFFQIVADRLAVTVRTYEIKEPYFHYENHIGTDCNHQQIEGGDIKKWEHYHYKLTDNLVKPKDSIPTLIGILTGDKNVLMRGLDEISIESVETVLELIEQNSLYRGEENKANIEIFLKIKKEYWDLIAGERDNFTWLKANNWIQISRIRNTAIGTLLIDLSEGLEIDAAVRKFEAMVAPANYKRPTALITKSMIANAEKKVEELGISSALQRRYAVMDDVSINNVLFADRLVKKAKNVFSELSDGVPDKVESFDKVEDVPIETFLSDILPKASSIEIMLDNKNIPNLVSLISPEDLEAKPILKWNNNSSWSYSGEVTDSIKERVKKAGGNVTGVLRCSLGWFNTDDLDIHIYEPNGNHIEYSSSGRVHQSSGILDVDMNVSNSTCTINAVENITWSDKNAMQEGNYRLAVHNYTKRNSDNGGFNIEIDYDNKIYSFNYDKVVRDEETISVAEFSFSRKDGIKILYAIPSVESTRQEWGINTQKFHKVTMVMNSPNHWDDNKVGNKHLFFMLDKCRNENKTRGLYNEFLKNDLQEHRKVLEVLGSKMKVPESENQLSGLGFSTTQRNSVLCRVTGSFNRVININF